MNKPLKGITFSKSKSKGIVRYVEMLKEAIEKPDNYRIFDTMKFLLFGIENIRSGEIVQVMASEVMAKGQLFNLAVLQKQAINKVKAKENII